MHLQFSFFQPSSLFSWDTHSKQSFRLDEKWFLWLRFCSFGPWSNSFDLCRTPWSNSFDLCRTLHALNTITSCILCILHFFVCIAFVLILLLCFSFVWVKIPKQHKKWKFQKVWLYMFEHISHMCLALYLRTNGYVHLQA